MNVLRAVSGGFELAVPAAIATCVPKSEVDRAFEPEAQVLRPSFDDARVVLLPGRRDDFIAGLLRAWSTGRLPYLASSEKVWERALPQENAGTKLSAPGKQDGGRLFFEADDVVAELLTSGTTGAPQVFQKRARQLFGEALVLSKLLDLNEKDTVLSSTASHHVYGLLFSLLAPWAAGARVIAHANNEPATFHPDKVAALVKEHEVTCLVTVPAHLRALVLSPAPLASVRTIVCSAAALDPRDAQAAEERFGAVVVDVLGSTETGGIATRRPAHSPAWSPLPGVHVNIDGDGQLFVRSPFLEDPLAPWCSGDRAELGPDGTFTHLGRTDGIIKVGGKRVSAQEIESIARKVPGVLDAYCFAALAEGLRGQEIRLAASSYSVSKAELKAALRGALDPVFLPRKIRILRELPRSDRGKVDRSAILKLFETTEEVQPGSTRIEIPLHIAPDSLRFVGHFPGNHLLPALAQLSDLILPEVRRVFGGGALVELTRVKWSEPIRKGADLLLVLEKKGQSVRFEIKLQVQPAPRTACSGTLLLSQDMSGEAAGKR